MNTEIKSINGIDHLVVTVPLQSPALSSSGKTLIVATSNGTKKTDVAVKGKPLSLTLSAWVKPD